MAETLLTSSQVGRLLRVSQSTVNRMATDGRLRYETRLSGPRGAYLFTIAAVEAYLADQDKRWAS